MNAEPSDGYVLAICDEVNCRAVALVVLGLVVLVGLAGCSDDPVEPRELGPYEVTTLREGVDSAIFGDLNENGQALWHEGEQAVLWDNGALLEVPLGKFLGSSGEVVGDSSVWIQGQLTELPGSSRGIMEDGTIYLSRNDTMFTWKDGVLTSTPRPEGYVGPEGRIWVVRLNPDEDPMLFYDEVECGFYRDGEWHRVVLAGACSVIMAEENGWAIIFDSGGTNPGRYVFGPDSYRVGSRDNELSEAPIVHVNSQGHSVTEDGFVARGLEDKTDLWEHFDSLRPGAINDDGEILAQLDDRVVLLTPR